MKMNKFRNLTLLLLLTCCSGDASNQVTITLANNSLTAAQTLTLYQNQDAQLVQINTCDGTAETGDGTTCANSSAMDFFTTTTLSATTLPDTTVLLGFEPGFYWASFLFQRNDADEGCLLSAASGVFEVEVGEATEVTLTVGIPHDCDTNFCADGESTCDGVCVDLNTDTNNCGECGNTCDDGETCNDGECLLDCVGGTTSCDNVCANLDTDADNCGACGSACDSGEACNDGECFVECSGSEDSCDGVCVDLDTDTDHCGACGSECNDGEACIDGECQLDCVGGTTACGDVCADLETDQGNCGECGLSCGVGESCTNGVCIEE